MSAENIVIKEPPPEKSKVIRMIEEQNARDAIRARLIRKLQHQYDLEVGLVDTGNFYAVADYD